jgi:predicted DNA-binding transcriptional regulator AlpA
MVKLQNSSQKRLVDARQGICRIALASGGHGGNGDDVRSCAEEGEPRRLITAAEISAMCGKPSLWFCRHRVRIRFRERGFPEPIIRGRWLRSAVEAWLEQQGTRASQSSQHQQG